MLFILRNFNSIILKRLRKNRLSILYLYLKSLPSKMKSFPLRKFHHLIKLLNQLKIICVLKFDL
ncbi:MAG: hypothetical protein FD181_2184 [Prolixibacteraceae bacterium]|nr:MAG: hypothetical protein FD181_2184 [Prolixibacteraceae bacterium]